MMLHLSARVKQVAINLYHPVPLLAMKEGWGWVWLRGLVPDATGLMNGTFALGMTSYLKWGTIVPSKRQQIIWWGYQDINYANFFPSLQKQKQYHQLQKRGWMAILKIVLIFKVAKGLNLSSALSHSERARSGQVVFYNRNCSAISPPTPHRETVHLL